MKIELAGHYGYGRILKTSVPSVLMMLFMSVYGVVDGFFVSNYAGTTSFAALNMVWPALMVVGAIGLMFGTGGSALVAMIIGQNDRDRANRIFSMLTRTMLAVGTVIAVIMFIFIRSISSWLGATDGQMLDDCTTYGRILLCVMPLFMTQMEFQSFFMTAERPQLGTWITVISGVTNMVLDFLFIVVFKWGLTGAAIATAISQAIGGLFPLVYFGFIGNGRWNDTPLKCVGSGRDWRSIRQACANGLSEFVNNISYNVLIICYNLQLMKLIGQDGVAVYGIIQYLAFLFAAIFIGYNMAVSPIVSYNYGARNHTELKSLLRKSIVILVTVGCILTMIAELFAVPLSKVFVGHEPELCRLATRAIRLYMISFMIWGFNNFISAWFTSLNNGIVSAIASFTRTFVFEMGCVFVLPLLFGLDGVWISVDVADCLALIMAVYLLKKFKQRYKY
ncbi:MAG: MATE family efflux transporter [Bacteroidaceae bacterium]|nr:MATE family efflux transporter [Bacteroidaceae bacterium]